MSELLPLWDVLALGLFAFIGSLVFGITGFGAALLSIPLALHIVPLKFALAVFALWASVLLSVLQVVIALI